MRKTNHKTHDQSYKNMNNTLNCGSMDKKKIIVNFFEQLCQY